MNANSNPQEGGAPLLDQRSQVTRGSSDAEQVARERERIAEEREKLAQEREKLAEEREKVAEEREVLAERREQLAGALEERVQRSEQREAVADRRERLADDRERLADEREIIADERERLADAREGTTLERKRRSTVRSPPPSGRSHGDSAAKRPRKETKTRSHSDGSLTSPAVWSPRSRKSAQCARAAPRPAGPGRIRTQHWLGAASPKLASGGYIDRKGVKIRTGPPVSIALSSALGSPRSTLEPDPVARIASPISPRFAACSMSAAESLYRSRTVHSD
jgi:hypothetical protein